MSKKTGTKKIWWIFFPLKGLEISEESHGLDKPMFGDITIISKKHIKQIVPLLKLGKRESDRHDNEKSIIYMFENATFDKEFQSFIAVRRTGTVSENTFEPEIIKVARYRAYQFASLLSLVFLSRSKTKETCCLVEQLHDQSKTTIMLCFQEPSFRFQGGGGHSFSIRDSRKDIKLSLLELKQLLYKKTYEMLTKAILPQRPSLPKSIHQAISQSSTRLSDAIHSIVPSTQLLGAITSIEILLTYQTDKYDIIKERIISLLGTKSIVQHDVESIFHSRHLYVHQGEEVSKLDIPLKAIELALSCLLRFSELSSEFSDKTKFLEYLDFIRQSDKLFSNWGKAEIRAFKVLQKHERKGYKFPLKEI